jgi:hypothetical protein
MFDSASDLIQLMLAPGLMISACGLLLLGMNNKYSLVVNRIRLLNEERRKMRYEAIKVENYKKRHKSIDTQISRLRFRVALVRNAVFSYSLAVAFFILSSLCIGYVQILQNDNLTWMIITLFLSGMIFVLAGIVFAALEVWKGFSIVKIEIEDNS